MDFLKSALADAKQKTSSFIMKRPLAAMSSTESSSASASASISDNGSNQIQNQNKLMKTNDGTKKYFRRGELEAIQMEQAKAEEEARKKQKFGTSSDLNADVRENGTSTGKTNHVNDVNATQPGIGVDYSSENENNKGELLSAFEVKCRLRRYGEPITLFGETDYMRINRLKQVEIRSFEKNEGSLGRTNLMKEIEQEVENELLHVTNEIEITHQSDDDEANTSLTKHKKGKREGKHDDDEEEDDDNDNDDDEDSPHGDKTSQTTSNKSNESRKQQLDSKQNESSSRKSQQGSKYDIDRSRDEFHSAEKFLLHFFKRLMHLWEQELDARSTQEKMSVQGRALSAEHKQTRKYLKPFLKLLKDRQCPADILPMTDKMCQLCLQREYVKANEAYFRIAIGNAAWPMGVTMVGIHERAGREKISDGNIAHVMNDETQRKYIHAIKRLMTYCASRFPAPPSKTA
jgi:pre-mRNA-splicing factor 18